MSNISQLGEGKSLPMSVSNLSFLLDRLGQDCAPLQYLRELTQNSIEAITRLNSQGDIIWDVDWVQYDLTTSNVMKLCLIDTGIGMTGKEMLQFINKLSSSGAVQSMSQNYGIGAKIAAATKNPAGVVYQSWKDGEGYMIHLEKDHATGQYGLRQWHLDDGTYSHYVPLSDDIKPEEIGDHGTKVILMGDSVDSVTMEAPKDAASPSRWISKYLNTRYFEFPENVTVKAREGWNAPRSDKDRNLLRTISGQKAYLDQHSDEQGKHQMRDAVAHWWILSDTNAIGNNSGYIESGHHMAALYQNELYDRETSRAGTAKLQQFGILFGAKYVVLYVEPIPEESQTLTTNTARTTLLKDGAPLPWADWAYEFRETMPEKLRDYIQKKAEAVSEKDHTKTIKDRLKGIIDLYKVSRYKPLPKGMYLADDTTAIASGLSQFSGKKSSGGGKQGKTVGNTGPGSRDGEVGNIYHLFQKKGGVESEETTSDPFPIVKWVTIKDESREPEDMEDRAAKYLSDLNTLLINADFRVFTDMTSKLSKEKDVGSTVNVNALVEDIVHAWFEQALVETVLGIQQLKGTSKEWGTAEIESALSQEALTSAVMQRYHIHIACKRELGAKLGKALVQEE